MTTQPRPPRQQPRPRRTLLLDHPPPYLARVPERLIAPSSLNSRPPRPESDLIGWLRSRGISARPSLAEVEGERIRRGLRRGVLGSSPASRPVLPMPGTAAAVRVEAARNRARIVAAFDGTAA